MSSDDILTQPAADAIWPPQPSDQGVWPPSPDNSAQAFPFQYLMRKASGTEAGRAKLSDFRAGTVHLGPEGVVVNGKQVLRAEIRFPIYIVCLIVMRLLGLIVYLIMEYGFRRDHTQQIPWTMLRQVQLSPTKPQACLVYEAPNHKGIMKTFSLAFRMDPSHYPLLAAFFRQHTPALVVEQPLRRATSLRLWIRLGVLALIFGWVLLSALLKHH